MSVKEKLIQAFEVGDVDLAGEIIKDIDGELRDKEIQDILLKISFGKQSILPYVVIIKLLLVKESANLHAFASVLLSNPLCWIEGAYYSGFYHQKRAVELEPKNVQFKEYLLTYNSLPDAILSDEEALVVRKQILMLEPDNRTVKLHFDAPRFVGRLD